MKYNLCVETVYLYIYIYKLTKQTERLDISKPLWYIHNYIKYTWYTESIHMHIGVRWYFSYHQIDAMLTCDLPEFRTDICAV